MHSDAKLQYLTTRTKQLAIKFILKSLMIQDIQVIKELDILQSSLEDSDKYRLKTGLPILEAPQQV